MTDFDRTRASRLKQKGAGRFAFLLLLALTAAIVYLMAMFIPPYLGNSQMQEATAEIVRRGALQNLSEGDVKAQLQAKARELGLPEDHRVELKREGKKLTARVTYTQSVQFPFYTYKWPVEIRSTDLGF